MKNHKLYGAILGDLCGQPFEFPPMKGPYINVDIHNPNSDFTDDTIMTLATAYALLNDISFEKAYKLFGKIYYGDHYGKNFKTWIYKPYGILNDSIGNGALMRVSPIMYVSNNQLEIDMLLAASCYNSHANVDSYNTCLALKDLYSNKYDISYMNNVIPFTKFESTVISTYNFIENLFGYSLKNGLTSTESIIKAVECGGDTDTNASIIGELMNYIKNDLTIDDINYVESKLDPFLLDVLKEFNEKY